MFKLTQWLCLAALAGWAAAPAYGQEPAKKQADRPLVEVVFCLDTTGSMGGLIDAAKAKIWAISNQIASGKPTPRLRVGLIGYRDRGDQYVTKLFDLTDDLDAIHGHLMGFKAQGGGDTPESVNQALHEAVTKVSWTKGQKALKIIFLVGDAPPKHYADDVPYKETCAKAAKNDIIINTVQCGGDAQTRTAWQDICRLAEGSYVQIDQKGGPVVVHATPFDKDLAEINTELARSTLTFGNRARQMEGKAKADVAAKLAPAAAAERAAYFGRSGGGAAGKGYDLLDSVKAGEVKLKDVKDADLPEELQKLKTLAEREAYLKKLAERREELNRKAVELDRKRGQFIAKKVAEEGNKARDSFDNQVLTILQRQATRVNIQYATPEGKKKE